MLFRCSTCYQWGSPLTNPLAPLSIWHHHGKGMTTRSSALSFPLSYITLPSDQDRRIALQSFWIRRSIVVRGLIKAGGRRRRRRRQKHWKPTGEGRRRLRRDGVSHGAVFQTPTWHSFNPLAQLAPIIRARKDSIFFLSFSTSRTKDSIFYCALRACHKFFY
jgi:hypothetical protein